jgi:hypothetical protein
MNATAATPNVRLFPKLVDDFTHGEDGVVCDAELKSDPGEKGDENSGVCSSTEPEVEDGPELSTSLAFPKPSCAIQ